MSSRAENEFHNKSIGYKKRNPKTSHSVEDRYKGGGWLFHIEDFCGHEGRYYNRSNENRYRRGAKSS